MAVSRVSRIVRGIAASTGVGTSSSTAACEANAITLIDFCRIPVDARVLGALYNHGRTVGSVLIDHAKIGVEIRSAGKRRTSAVPLVNIGPVVGRKLIE